MATLLPFFHALHRGICKQCVMRKMTDLGRRELSHFVKSLSNHRSYYRHSETSFAAGAQTQTISSLLHTSAPCAGKKGPKGVFRKRVCKMYQPSLQVAFTLSF